MKKIIVLFLVLFVLGGCQFMQEPVSLINSDDGMGDEQDEVKEFNIAEYDLQAKQEMPSWYTMWQKTYNSFTLADFEFVGNGTVEFYSEREYTERIAKYVTQVIESPDYHKLITIYYGGDPDSGVGIVIKDEKMQKFITSMQCGTPCLFLDGFWLDNDRFLVAGEGEVYPNGYDYTLETGVYHYAPYLYLVDLAENTWQRYEAEPVLLEEYQLLRSYSVLFDKFHIDYNIDWQELKKMFLNHDYFVDFSPEGFSKTIEDIRINDINGDLYLDLLVFNDKASSERLKFYDSIVSDSQNKEFKKGPIVPDTISYVYGTNLVNYGDRLNGWETTYEWLGSNLIMTESQTNQVQDPSKTDWSVDYTLQGGVSSIPEDIRCIINYEFTGEKLKLKDGNNGNGFVRLDNPDNKFDSFTIKSEDGGYNLILENEASSDLYLGGFFKVDPDCQVEKINK